MSESRTLHFFVQHRLGRSPGQRFRHEQYLQALAQAGFTIHYHVLLNDADDALFSSAGRYLKKALLLLRMHRTRTHQLRQVLPGEVAFIFRDIVPYGSTRFERALARRGARIVFDFDDAIWLPSVSANNRALGFLKRPQKVKDILPLCQLVLAGNAYLADYARQYSPHVTVVPTTLDTTAEEPAAGRYRSAEPVVIGWMGSHTTLPHLMEGLKPLAEVKTRYGSRVAFRIVAQQPVVIPELGTTTVPWHKDTELQEHAAFDIGIMPLPNDPWTQGKCGFKGLRYMAHGIPTVMSAVGVNTEIIEDGVNGFLARTDAEWVEKLSLLIENPDLRERLGRAGRKTVEQRYSVNAWREKYIELLNGI